MNQEISKNWTAQERLNVISALLEKDDLNSPLHQRIYDLTVNAANSLELNRSLILQEAFGEPSLKELESLSLDELRQQHQIMKEQILRLVDELETAKERTSELEHEREDILDAMGIEIIGED